MKKNKNYLIAGILLLIFVLGYFITKQLGWLEILARLNEERLGYGLIFLIGLLASFHCLGMCGGLVITYSAKHSITTKKSPQRQTAKLNFSWPHLQYNLGRLISYTVIGGILGGFGSFFAINPTLTGIITLAAGVFMILMGLSLTTKHQWLEKIKLRTPAWIARFLFNQKDSKKPKGPFMIGLLNGLMPCGPLQAMQLYALASGSITRGALSLGFYALGTIPLMFGFGSFISLISHNRIKKIMQVSGLIVILLGLLMINRGLINFGYGFNALMSNQSVSNQEKTTPDQPAYQTVTMDLTYNGYSPEVLYVKKDLPVRWVINAQQISGCTKEIIMPAYNIRKKLSPGENIIEFTPQKTGAINFSCGMRMVWGKFIVAENSTN